MKHFIDRSLYYSAGVILVLPRIVKLLIVITIDITLCVLTIWLAYYLRLGEFISLSGNRLIPAFVSIIIVLPIFYALGLYKAIFRYSGWPALLTVTYAIAIYGIIYFVIFTAIGVEDVPRTVGIIQPILLLLFVGASRALARVWLGADYISILQRSSRPKALVYGAGKSGQQLVSAISDSSEIQIVGFLDDDEGLHGCLLHGLKIYDSRDLKSIKSTQDIKFILLAMPQISVKKRNEIFNIALQLQLSVRVLPSMYDLVQGRISFSDMRDLDIDDLLGRDPVWLNQQLLSKNLSHKVVLVTGAGGSIGSELCRQIIKNKPKKLLLVEHSEFALYSIHQELIGSIPDGEIEIVPLLGSIQSREFVREIMSTWCPDTIYHTASYKHVPLVEHNIIEGIKNNVFGTLNIAITACDYAVSDFVLISSDKAVRPTNVMGATKRLSEMVLQALAPMNNTKLAIVRFGNVLGSSGSVIPKFRQQIKNGGPVTVTHPEVTRYFMTISEAVQLSMQAGAIAKNGEVLVLDMGEPVKILELARRMIELSGLRVKEDQSIDGDIEIIITGLRPGEKLYEELLIGDNPLSTPHPKIMKANEDYLSWDILKKELDGLEISLKQNNLADSRFFLKKLVNGYRSE